MASGTISNPFKVGTSINLSVANNKINETDISVRQVGAFLVISGYFHNTSSIGYQEKMFDWPAGVPVPQGVTNYLILTNGENKSAAWFANPNGFFGYDSISSKYWNLPTTVIPIT